MVLENLNWAIVAEGFLQNYLAGRKTFELKKYRIKRTYDHKKTHTHSTCYFFFYPYRFYRHKKNVDACFGLHLKRHHIQNKTFKARISFQSTYSGNT